jgi:hypothetical protein
MEGTATTVNYSTISNHELVEKFAKMNQKLVANPPPDFDINDWQALGRELVDRIPGVHATQLDG